MNANVAIIIPARFASTRFPGKPLAILAGKSVLAHVVDIARKAIIGWDDVKIYVTTDDDRIAAAASELGVGCLMTSPDLKTGTDRVMAAADQLSPRLDFIINLQGDAPLTPPHFITAMLDTYWKSKAPIITPVVRLTWDELDALRISKITTPFSGTTVVMDAEHKALWFSKNIIPALRNEKSLQTETDFSPVYRHIGLYAYSYDALKKYISLPQSPHEDFEGLEQLRALENGMTIRCVPVEYNGLPAMTGIDSPEDLVRAEALLAS